MRFFAPLNNEPTPALLAIEIATSLQIPSFHIIGLPAPEVSEARERIRAAIEHSSLTFPKRRLIVNLSPASVRKRGTGLDLAIALAILSDAKNRKSKTPAGSEPLIVASGELSLDGRIRSAGGVTRTLYAAWRSGASLVLLPEEDYPTAQESLALIGETARFPQPQPSILPVATLAEAWEQLCSGRSRRELPLRLFAHEKRAPAFQPSPPLLPLSPLLERAVLCSSTGLHHLLLLGPKGAGKSYAMAWLEALQDEREGSVRLHHQLLSELNSNAAQPQSAGHVRKVGPHVRPHSLVGTARGTAIRPGEYSLAHGGILIADEFPEWHRDSRESLRGPLESGSVWIPGASGPGASVLPARFLFAATGNLCPCGGWPREMPLPKKNSLCGSMRPSFCRCPLSKKKLYRARLSGPVLDRLDIAVLVASTPQAGPQESNESEKRIDFVRSKRKKAQTALVQAWGRPPGLLTSEETETLLYSHPKWNQWLSAARIESLRSRHKVVRIALTLAALDEAGEPSAAHFAEAGFYRPETMIH